MCVFAIYGVPCLAVGFRGSGAAGLQGVRLERVMLHVV